MRKWRSHPRSQDRSQPRTGQLKANRTRAAAVDGVAAVVAVGVPAARRLPPPRLRSRRRTNRQKKPASR
jgi:hypothetical protein